MSLCREWTIVKSEPEHRQAKPLYCRSWGCELCQPKRKSQLMALASSGEPTRFLTLTVNPAVASSPEERLKLLARAWRVIVQRLRRIHSVSAINYLAIVEETKRGEPHLHILLRSPYIPQALLSGWMGSILASPIVDIRLIRNQKEVVRYVAKYIAKNPAQFGKSKRYWSSRDYELDQSEKPIKATLDPFPWRVDKRSIYIIFNEWIHEGYYPRFDGTEPYHGYREKPPPTERVETPSQDGNL